MKSIHEHDHEDGHYHKTAHSDSHDHDHSEVHFHGNAGNLIVTTLGFVVHSIADGIALGTSCYATQGTENSMPFIIFLALLLHKMPEAIGLTTFLRHEELPFKQILTHLLIITLTSPISAIVGYWAFTLFSVANDESSNAFVAVGILLLISGGTFMYVAMIHIHKHKPEDHAHDDNHFSKQSELLATVAGLLAPIGLHLLELIH